jgi:putative ABC transport system permease protein
MPLSALGGLAGTLLGVAAIAIYALTQHWTVLIPPQALYCGTGAALAIGALAGLYQAMRAAGLSPIEALRTA